MQDPDPDDDRRVSQTDGYETDMFSAHLFSETRFNDNLLLSFGYNFKTDSEGMIERLPQHWQDEAMRAYIDDLGVGATRSTVIDALNDGVALTSFVGHSGATEWTFDGVFLASDAVAMTNTLRPTIVTQWGC